MSEPTEHPTTTTPGTEREATHRTEITMSTTQAPQPSVDDVETLLRDALHARAEQVTEASLSRRQPAGAGAGPAAVRSLPAARERAVGGRDAHARAGLMRRAGGPLAAAALVVAVAGVGSGLGWFPGAGAPARPPAPPSTLGNIQVVAQIDDAGDGTQRLTIGFGRERVQVAGTAAVSVRPVTVVTGGTPALRDTTRAATQQLLDTLTARYGTQLRRLGVTSDAVEQQISVRAASQRADDVSIVFDVVEDYRGAVPSVESAAVVLSKRTGAAVSASDLFDAVDAVDAVMRSALQKKYDGQLDQQVLSRVTMSSLVDEKSSLTWYPTQAGLHWVVARGVLGADALGSVSVVVPWSALPGRAR